MDLFQVNLSHLFDTAYKEHAAKLVDVFRESSESRMQGSGGGLDALYGDLARLAEQHQLDPDTVARLSSDAHVVGRIIDVGRQFHEQLGDIPAPSRKGTEAVLRVLEFSLRNPGAKETDVLLFAQSQFHSIESL